ncbi:hypothetical protein BC826DRAFT_150190 [Russula brevipes]|nr:hypothetical protein BC826DRAFT_150190 [Russula brevipes]
MTTVSPMTSPKPWTHSPPSAMRIPTRRIVSRGVRRIRGLTHSRVRREPRRGDSYPEESNVDNEAEDTLATERDEDPEEYNDDAEAEDTLTAERDEDLDEETSYPEGQDYGLRAQYDEGVEYEGSNYDEFDGTVVPLDEDGQDYGSDGTQYNEDFECENSNYDEFDGSAAPSDNDDQDYVLMAVVTTRTPKRRTQTVESEAEARPTSPQFEDADWETRYDATRDRCQSAQEAHTQHTSNNKLVTEFNETSGRHVDAHARHDRQSAEYADIVQRVPPEPPPLDGTIKAKIPPQSANPDRPADRLHHAGMRVITHDAHQGNRCDPWLVPSPTLRTSVMLFPPRPSSRDTQPS